MIRLLLIIVISILVIGCTNIGNKAFEQGKKISPIQTESQTSPKIILLVIDSIMDEPLKKAIQEKKAPALAFFLKHGQYSKNLVSSYPTMSVTIDSSLITGTYPDKSKIPGLVWFDHDKKQIITYGNGFFEIMKLGVSQFAENIMHQYNNVDLSPNVRTIHEDLNNIKKESASINALIYRGNYPHTLKVPKLITKVSNLPEEYETVGPKMLSLGAFIHQDSKNNHLVNRIGLNDAFAVQELKYLLENNILPEFTILYISENDFTVHRKGPNTTKGIEKLDKHLQEVLNTFPKWEDALHNNIWVIIGDSNQSPVNERKKEALIDLKEILSKYRILKLSKPVAKDDEIVITANERMAYIYKINESVSVKNLAGKLQTDPRIAWIAWKEKEMIHVISGDHKGSTIFKPGGTYKDIYNQSWTIKGNTSILDLTLKNKNIHYGDYPDGLARLYGAMHSQEGEFLIVDAKPGYEFIGESSPEHSGGGAHGSMHKDDSLIPIIVTGTNKSIDHMRIVDLKKWILNFWND
ncbi:alkaline phosphatase family protein [Bacillus sp. ISL-47]|uniref:alkaline phosphatase family protein n=1 Tax=Bacillus sp. ISL-47 TaxID=2819130 RepID=UPI001BEC0929|nr:alkaline phosphatase family protein [Bacillus sp. ISL-47]MBT2686739.1 alkaline phosphatase family protein [Bacillus sp. ISL-47]MBT2706913.1 alkaline phosphatase family protein [Pseudomonas sp. ISL-84]